MTGQQNKHEWSDWGLGAVTGWDFGCATISLIEKQWPSAIGCLIASALMILVVWAHFQGRRIYGDR
jgi:hypothetical protein